MKKVCSFIILLYTVFSYSQNTVGVLRNEINAYDGYTLFTSNFSTETYLINNCGEVVHQWTSTFNPGNSVYLLDNGNLLRTGKIANPDITFGGVGGKIELFDWDNNLLWEYTYSSPLQAQHHDIYPLPNGNVLMLAVDTMNSTTAIAAGRNPSIILENKIFNEQILELEPVGTNQANIVWQWNIKDHLIQDFDNTKSNYGVIANHPELLDFNYLNSSIGNANWLHFNSIQYNASLKQIVISSRLLDEIYIIEHSDNTSIAGTHTGGLYGKGGDFLYRWGNPEAYDHGDSNDKTLFSQHYPHWIPDGLNDAGKLMIFNNGNAIRQSALNIVSPPTTSPGVYAYDAVNGYGPVAAEWTYKAPNPENFFSSILSSGQRLPNGNTLICDGDSGYFFEIDASNNIVWEYINPDANNGIATQGDPPPNQNFVFRALKLPKSHPAFAGRDLTPGNPVELNPDLSNCSLLNTENFQLADLKIYPNPTSDILTVKTLKKIDLIEVYNTLGKLLLQESTSNRVDLSNLSKGLYIIKIKINGAVFSKKIIKQ